MNVAQLKPFRLSNLGLVCGVFPRSNERGSIEAPDARQYQDDGDEFPRSNERGSIEAIENSMPTVAGVAFPRSNERGSIEASLVPVRWNRLYGVSTFE